MDLMVDFSSQDPQQAEPRVSFSDHDEIFYTPCVKHEKSNLYYSESDVEIFRKRADAAVKAAEYDETNAAWHALRNARDTSAFLGLEHNLIPGLTREIERRRRAHYAAVLSEQRRADEGGGARDAEGLARVAAAASEWSRMRARIVALIHMEKGARRRSWVEGEEAAVKTVAAALKQNALQATKPTRKSVQFSPAVNVQFRFQCGPQAPQEDAAAPSPHWTNDEIARIKHRARALSKRHRRMRSEEAAGDAGHAVRYEIEGESLRGMELFTEVAIGRCRLRTKREAIRSTITAQQDARTGGAKNESRTLCSNELAKLYRSKAQSALIYALRVAEEDATVAREILAEDLRVDSNSRRGFSS